MANQSVEIPLEVNVSTADPNETVKNIDRIPAFVSSSLLSSNPPPGELDHTQNNGIYQESGITNQQLMSVGVLGGIYNYVTEDGQNIQISNASSVDPYSNAPMRTVSIDGKTIDYIPSHGLESVQTIYGQYDDMIMSDNGNYIGMKILANQYGASGYQTGASTFTSTTTPSASLWSCMAYGNGYFVGLQQGGTANPVIRSSDGITWNTTTNSGGAGPWTSVVFGGSNFVAVSTAGITLTSTDGASWTAGGVPPAPSVSFYCVGYGAGVFVAVGYADVVGKRTMRSTNGGSTWSAGGVTPSSAYYDKIAYGSGYFICTSSSGNYAPIRSTDGTSWSAVTSIGGANNNCSSIVYADGYFIVTVIASNLTFRSSDVGTTWTAIGNTPSTPAGSWQNLTFGNGVVAAVSLANGVIRSTDYGTTWAAATGTTTGTLLAYGNGIFSVITYNSTVARYSNITASSATSNLKVRIDEIDSTGSAVNSVERNFSGIGYGLPVCLVRQTLGSGTPFTWASSQYILAAETVSLYNVYLADSGTGTVQLTTGKILLTGATPWATGFPKYIWCAKMFGRTEYVSVAQGGAGNATAFSTSTVLTMGTYCWAVMQSKSGYNRIILSGQTNVATTSSYLGISGYNVFTSATYQLVPTGNAVDATTEGIGSSGYAYVDIYRTTNLNHYYSSYNDPATTGALAVANGLFVAKVTSQGQIRGFGRVSWISYVDNGNVKPAFEFRVMYAPYYTTSNGAATTASTTSIAVGISVATCYDGTGGAINGIPAGVPITTYGEFDATFAPQINATFDSIMWRYNGVYYIAKVSTNPIRPIQKISSRLYKLNTISPVNVIDSVSRTLNLGSNDYHGGAVLTGGGSATTGVVNFMAYGAYANSVDTKLMAITTNAYTDGSQTPVGYTQPSVHTNFGYYPIYKYWNTGTSFGNIILDSSARPITSTSLTTGLFSSVNIYPFYVQNNTIPIPLGLNWSGRSIGTNSSATTYSFQETFITGGYVGGATTVTSDYDGYIIGNAIPANGITFTLFSTNYFFDGRSIFQISFNGAYVQFPLQKAVTADGLQFIAQSQDKAFFLSAFDNSIYIFDGGRSLYKMRKFTLNGPISQGVFNVRDNTLMLDATTQWIWMRDGIISFDTKNSNQAGQALSFYDTTKGIYIGNNTRLYQYGYSQSQIFVPTSLTGTKDVVPLDFQTAYYGMGANKISLELSYYVTVFNASKAKTALNVTIYGFNQDEQKGFVNQNPQKSVVNINPADYDDAGYFRFSVTPRYSKVLASSIGIKCATKIAVVEVMLRYDDASIEAVYAPNRRART